MAAQSECDVTSHLTYSQINIKLIFCDVNHLGDKTLHTDGVAFVTVRW